MDLSSERPAPPPLGRFGPGVAGLFSLLVFASLLLVPLLGLVLALLASLPLVHLLAGGRSTVLGWGWVAVALAGTALLVQKPWSLALLVGYLIVAAWPAWSVELWARRRWSTGRWLAVVAAVSLAVTAAALAAYSYPHPPAEALSSVLVPDQAQQRQLAELLGGGGRWRGEEIVAWATTTTSMLVPALATLYVIVGALWLRPRLRLLGVFDDDVPFATYASEEWLPVAFAVGGLGWVFATGDAKWLSANLLTVVLGLYFVHGLAIIHFHLGRRLAANRWVRLAVVLFALQMPLTLVVAALGLTDTFYRLRRGSALEGGSER